MTVQMNIAEAKAKLSELIARAEAGERVVIARDGVPAVVIEPLPRARRIGFYDHLIPPGSWDPQWAMDDDDPRDWGEDALDEPGDK